MVLDLKPRQQLILGPKPHHSRKDQKHQPETLVILSMILGGNPQLQIEKTLLLFIELLANAKYKHLKISGKKINEITRKIEKEQ